MSHKEHSCDLCGLPAGSLPYTRAIEGQERAFCCAGCLNVYVILQESGVLGAGGDFRQSEIYLRSAKLGLIANGERSEPSLPPDAETTESVYQLSGLWCTSCGWLIEHALLRERGIVSAEVIFTSDLLKVRYCPQYIVPSRIPARVESLGYRAAEYSGERAPDRAEWRDLLLRLGIAAGLWMNVMLFSLVVYASYFEGIADWARQFVPFILMALTTPAVFYSAWPILRVAYHGLRNGSVRMEALISTGVLAAYFYSSAQAFLGGQHYYFDTACAIVTLVLAGKALERGAKERTAHSIAMLHRLMPNKARLLQDGRERFVSIEALCPGMTILVKPGERIAADGVIREGTSPVDESVVTGESEPRSRGIGDGVVAGSLNGAGVLSVEVTRAGAATTLARIVQSVESAMASRMPLERAVDRASRLFVPAVLAISALMLASGSFVGLSRGETMLRAIAVLVIACPCALGIATPLATTAAVGTASRRGILIRDARVLETIRSIDVLVLDKTGTVTEGEFRVRESTLDEESLGLAAALESVSEHPVAGAVIRFAQAGPVPLPKPQDVAIYQGMGLTGTVNDRQVAMGSERLMLSMGVALAECLREQASGWARMGLTVTYCAVDGKSAGAVALGDRPRAEAAALVAALKDHGVKTLLLSGDSPQATACMAGQLGIDEHRGGVTPAEKAEVIQRFRADGKIVAMAGDGMNDAPALAAADLGIAMAGGTDLAMQAAPVVLMGESLLRIADTFDLAQQTLRVVRQNLFWAFFYNTLGITLALTGILNPILAAAAMVLSSLSVIGNSLRLNSSQAGYSGLSFAWRRTSSTIAAQ